MQSSAFSSRAYPDPWGVVWRLAWLRMLLTWHNSLWQIFWLEWLLAITLYTLVLTMIGLFDKYLDYVPSEAIIQTILIVTSKLQAGTGFLLGFYCAMVLGRWYGVSASSCAITARIKASSLILTAAVRAGAAGAKAPRNTEDLREGGGALEREGGAESPAKAHDEDDAPKAGSGDDGGGAGEAHGGAEMAGKVEDVPGMDSEDARRLAVMVDPDAVPASREVLLLKTMIRWLSLSHALTIGSVLDDPSKRWPGTDLSTEVERKELAAVDPPQLFNRPIYWYCQLLIDLHERTIIPQHAHLTLRRTAEELRQKCQGLMLAKNVPVWLSYRQVLIAVVRGYLFFLAIGTSLARISQTGFNGGAYWGVIGYGMEYVIFVGWLTFAEMVANPFRKSSAGIDFDRAVWETHVACMALLVADIEGVGEAK